MQSVLVTGAAGGIGSRLRKLLKGVYPRIRWSDIKKPDDLAADEALRTAEEAINATKTEAVKYMPDQVKAMEDALALSRFCESVQIIHRRDSFRK